MHKTVTKLVVAAFAGGLAVRMIALLLTPRYGYLPDHDDACRWGVMAAQRGVLSIYDVPPPRLKINTWTGTQWVAGVRDFDRLFCYPPATAYLLWFSGTAYLALVDEPMVNTFLTRTVFGVWGILGDFLLALGCAALSMAVLRDDGEAAESSSSRSIRISLAVFAAIWLLPPFWLDSTIWSQLDTLLAAGLVWTVWAMVCRRWMRAGALFGVSLMLKPTALLLGPLWLVALADREMRRGAVRGGLCALATAALIALLHTMHGGFAWWSQAYWHNVVDAFPSTTLMAFNIWYADLLTTESDNAHAVILGLTKDAWGRLLLLGALLALALWAQRSHLTRTHRLVIFCALWLLACVMFPTRVHERYVVLSLSFVVVVAVATRKRLLGPAILAVAATMQLAWPLWLQAEPGAWAQYEAVMLQKLDHGEIPLEEMPAFWEHMDRAKAAFRLQRRSTMALEWALVVLSITASAMIAWSLLRPSQPKTKPVG